MTPMKKKPFLALLSAVVLAGCADTHWERALYEGMRSAERPCQRNTADRRDCERLPSYDSYEQERRRAQGATP